jgi:AraC family transcriptional regulator
MTAPMGFDVSIYSSGIRHSPHQHDELQLSIVLKGSVSETVGTRTEYGTALSVVAKDSGVMHADMFGDGGTRIARLALRFGILGDLVDDPSRAFEWRWTHDPRVANPFLRLLRRAHTDGTVTFDTTDPDVLDLIAAFTARPVRTASGQPPRWLEQTVIELREGWRPNLRVADVARRAGVHPVYLARCVRRWYGRGVAEEMRLVRMRSASRALAETRETVSRIAHSSGFADEPHLCREFRRTLGVTPRGYRSIVGKLS